MEKLIKIMRVVIKCALVTLEATWLTVLVALTVLPRVAAGIVETMGLSAASPVQDWVALGLVPYLVIAALSTVALAWCLKRLVGWTCRKVDGLGRGIIERDADNAKR